MLIEGELNDTQHRFDVVGDVLEKCGLSYSQKRGKCRLIHDGPLLSTPAPTTKYVEDLKLKHVVCRFCGVHRFVNAAGKARHETSCDLRSETHPGRFDLNSILEVRGPSESRFFLIQWSPDQLDDDITWEPSRHLDYFHQ